MIDVRANVACWFIFACACLTFGFSETPALAASAAPAMAVPGQFDVSATGAANYSIPLTVPPGTAGMKPSMSLTYSSQSSDGLLGTGWSLGGLSSVTRCPRTLAQDGIHGGVNYNADDRFCMDGKRLILLGGTGSYGADGSQYRTEVETFSKIIAHGGTVSMGPDWFEVHTKSGQVLEIGSSVSARVFVVSAITGAPIGVVRSWAVSKIYDIKGNYLAVTYNCTEVSSHCADTSRTTNGEVYPLRIDYTGNASASVIPYNSVRFLYSTRSDINQAYQAGGTIIPTHILTDVETYQGSSLMVSDYHLSYRAGTSVLHSRLTSVTLCDGSGICPVPCSGSSHCLASTTFGWQGGDVELTMAWTANSIGAGKSLLPGDFDGNGQIDVEVADPNSCSAFPVYLAPNFSTPGSSVPNPGSGDTSCSNTVGQTTLAPNGTATNLLTTNAQDTSGNPVGYVSLYQSFPNSNPESLAASIGSTAPPSISGDFDGTGIPGVTFLIYPISEVWAGDPSGGFFHQSDLPSVWASSSAAGGIDFDGDGCTDYLALLHVAGGSDTAIYSCSPAANNVPSPATSGFGIVFGDFNGDGKTDILLTSTTGPEKLYISTGTDFLLVNSTLPSGWSNYDVETGDWNGDGRTDLVLVSLTVGVASKLYLSTGTDFTPALDSSGNPISISNSAGPQSAVVADWNNDGAADFWLQSGASDTLYTFSYTPELMTTISNGIGRTTTVVYDRLNQNTFYTHTPFAGTYPIQEIDGPQYVAREVEQSNGLGTCTPPVTANCYRLQYSYAHAQTDLSGRGFLGFSQVVSTDIQTNIIETTDYNLQFPYTGMIKSHTKVHAGTTIFSTTNALNSNSGCGATPASAGIYVVCITQTDAQSKDLDGSSFPYTTTNYSYDNYGNVLTANISISDSSYRNTTNTYCVTSDCFNNWFLDRILTTDVQSSVGSSALSRHSSFTYATTTTGFLTESIVEPTTSTCNGGTSSCTVTTDYGYDSFGNRTSAAVSGSGIVTRTTSATYDSLGEFKVTATNALGQSEHWAYDQRFGTPTIYTNLSGISINWTYDDFGRLKQETRPDGTQTRVSYGYCSGSCPANGQFYSQCEAFAPDGVAQIGAISSSYFDMLSRDIADDTQGFDGSNVRNATTYGADGNVQQVSRPYFTASAVPIWTNLTYDDLGRVKTITLPGPTHTITNTYNALTVTTDDVASTVTHTKTVVRNAQALNYQITDAGGGTTTYVYDAFGNVVKVTDAAGNIITNAYDPRGHKVSSTDPDLGTWSYSYDILGELVGQTDAKGQVTSFSYDVVGRPYDRTEVGAYSSWTFGSTIANHDVGQLIRAKSCSSTSCSTVVSDRTFSYDAFGRAIVSTLKTAAGTYTFNSTYSATNGAIATTTRPSGFAQKTIYNSYGFACSLTDLAGSPTCTSAGGAQLFERINGRNAELQAIQMTAGNGVVTNQTFDANTGLVACIYTGLNCTSTSTMASLSYTFDPFGNLSNRTDSNAAYTERFCYDNLDRLTAYNIGSMCTGGKTASYDAIGNIVIKSDVGTYHYPVPGSARPHAVSDISGTVDGLSHPYYSYDGNGNLWCTSTISGCSGTVGRQLVMTAFNMPATVTQGANNLSLVYDDQHRRIQQTNVVSGVSTLTEYIGDPISGVLSERVTSGAASPGWTDYFGLDGKSSGQRVVIPSGAGPLWGSGITWGMASTHPFVWTSAAGTTAYYYFVLDHLGSISVVADVNGNTIQRLSYDAWGKGRNYNGTDVSCGTIIPISSRGYTGQEQMPTQCLVNLNARLYDASLGRFVAPDSVGPDAYDSQSFNRYTYVNNNPLSMIDPTGHQGTESVVVNGPSSTPPTLPTNEYGQLGGPGYFTYEGDAPSINGVDPSQARIGAARAGQTLPLPYRGNQSGTTASLNNGRPIEAVVVTGTKNSSTVAEPARTNTAASGMVSWQQVVEQVEVTGSVFHGPGIRARPYTGPFLQGLDVWQAPELASETSKVEPEDNSKKEITCSGPLRVMTGNAASVGKVGGLLRPIQPGTAAVVPRQFPGGGGRGGSASAYLRSIAPSISGTTAGGQTFNGVGDVINEAKVAPTAAEAQDIEMDRDPGRLLIELVTGHEEGRTTGTVTLPGSVCPQYTSPVGGK